MKENTTMNELINDIEDTLQATITEKLTDCNNVIKAFDSIGFANKVKRWENHISLVNQTLSDYCALLKGKVIGPEALKEIASFSVNPATLPTDIKIAYIDYHQIELPIKFKKESLAAGYDFTANEQALINSITEALVKLHQYKDLHDEFISSAPKLWSKDQGKFVLTSDKSNVLKERSTTYASPEDIQRAMSVELILTGLATLENCGWRFNYSDLKEGLIGLIGSDSLYATKVSDFKSKFRS